MNTKTLVSSLLGGAIGIGAAALLLLLFSLVALSGNDPDLLVPALAHAARLLGAAVGGFAAARINKENGLLCGALSGGLYSILILVIAALSPSSFSFITALLLSLAATVLSALLGLLGLPSEKSGKARRRSMMKRIR